MTQLTMNTSKHSLSPEYSPRGIMGFWCVLPAQGDNTAEGSS